MPTLSTLPHAAMAPFVLWFLLGAANARLMAKESDGIIEQRSLIVEEAAIPLNIWFIGTENILETRLPHKEYDNVIRTIETYKTAWNMNPSMEVISVDDVICAREIAIAEPRLLDFFKSDDEVVNKHSICRTAILYLYGGYYFDNDVEVVNPFYPQPGISFVAVEGCGGGCFANSFVAAAPKHPVLKQSLEQLLEVYENNMDTTLVGEIALRRAYLNLQPEERGECHILSELELQDEHYPGLARQDGWGHCNFVVHDPELQRVFFFSHFVGSATGCFAHFGSRAQGKLPLIYHRFWFTNDIDVYRGEEDTDMHDNIMHTIDLYRLKWGDTTAGVNFLDDEKCTKYLKKINKKLLKYFKTEDVGPYRGDMCKLAVLYTYGGYYFDVDIKTVEPFVPNETDEFVSVSSCNGACFFPSFIATVKEHPILLIAMKEMHHVYKKNKDHTLLAPLALAKAFERLNSEDKASVRLLEEIDLETDSELYPDVERQRGVGNCNYVVHDPEARKVHFFARYVGYTGCGIPDSFDEDR